MTRSCITPSFTSLKCLPTIFSQKHVARFALQVLRKDEINGSNGSSSLNDGSFWLTSKRDHSALSNSAMGMYLQHSHNTHTGTCSATARNKKDSIYFSHRGIKNEKYSNSFLTPGRQPTTVELADCNDFGFKGLDVRKNSNGGCVLPILDASVIL